MNHGYHTLNYTHLGGRLGFYTILVIARYWESPVIPWAAIPREDTSTRKLCIYPFVIVKVRDSTNYNALDGGDT